MSKKRYHNVRRKGHLPPPLKIYNPDYDLVNNIYPFIVRDLDSHPLKLDKYRGCVCIIINVTSKTKYVPEYNYKILSSLYEKYGESEGLRILAFPCNQFNNEEPRSNKEIKRFVKEQGLKFDFFAKINVNCDNCHPLWKYLKLTVKGKKNTSVITEPFTKFIIDRDGVPFVRLDFAAGEKDIYSVLKPFFKHKEIEEDTVKIPDVPVKEIEIPPREIIEELDCMKPWRFRPGILELI